MNQKLPVHTVCLTKLSIERSKGDNNKSYPNSIELPVTLRVTFLLTFRVMLTGVVTKASIHTNSVKKITRLRKKPSGEQERDENRGGGFFEF